MHRHTEAVGQTTQNDNHFGVLLTHPVVGDHSRLDAGPAKLAHQLEADVGDDLDVYPRVVVDLKPGHGVHVGGVPQRFQRRLAVDAIDHVAERAVAARRECDPHVADRLGRRHSSAALCPRAYRRAGFWGGSLRDLFGIEL